MRPFLFSAATLSVLGCVLNIIVTVYIKKIHHTPLGKMVIHLAIADLCLSFGDFITELRSEDKFDYFDYILESFQYFGNSASLMWACCFAHWLYCAGKYGNEELRYSQYRTYAILSYSAAFISGPTYLLITYLWYFHDPDYPDSSGALDVFFVAALTQVTISFILTLTFYLQGLKLVYYRRRQIPWILLVYPAIVIGCNLPFIVVNNILTQDPDGERPGYELVQSIWVIQGMLNALVFGLSSGLREAIKQKCCPESPEESQSTSGIETTYQKYHEIDVVNARANTRLMTC